MIFNLDKKRTLLFLAMIVLISGITTYLSIGNTLKYKRALDMYDEDQIQEILNKGSSASMEDIFDIIDYNRAGDQYSVSAVISTIISVAVLFLVYASIPKNRKITINEEGLKLYDLFKKERRIYAWNTLDHLEFKPAKGLRSIMSGFNMIIHQNQENGTEEKGIIPIENILNYREMPKGIKEVYPIIQVDISEDVKIEDAKLIELFKQAYMEYKSNFKDYTLFSLIIFVFVFLGVVFDEATIGFLTGVFSIFFGYRAKIAMNYMAYRSFNGEKVNFDQGWNYGKSRIDAYFKAQILIGLIVLIFIGIAYLCLISNLGRNYKIFIGIIIGLSCFLSLARIYLTPYIASIIDTDKSFMAYNGMIIKQIYQKSLVVVGIISLKIMPMIIIGWMYYKDLYTLNHLLDIVLCINAVIDLFLSPLISCFIMQLLRGLPMAEGVTHNA